MTTRTTPIAAAAVAALLLVGCGSSAGSDGTSTTKAKTADTTESDTTTTLPIVGTSAPETTTTSMPEDPEGTDTETTELDTLPDGVHYGYMAGKESGKVEGQDVQVIIFDKVDFLTGDEAVQAAQEDGVIPPDQDFIENDYYIRNQNQMVRRLAVVPDAQVSTLASEGSTDQVASSVDEVWNQPYLFKIDVGNVGGITTVSSIEAVFLP